MSRVTAICTLCGLALFFWAWTNWQVFDPDWDGAKIAAGATLVVGAAFFRYLHHCTRKLLGVVAVLLLATTPVRADFDRRLHSGAAVAPLVPPKKAPAKLKKPAAPQKKPKEGAPPRQRPPKPPAPEKPA